MSVHGPSPLSPRPFVPAALNAPGSARPRSAPAAPDAARSPSDGSLWNLLTDEERSYFAQQATLGLLTYGRSAGQAASPAAPIGQRLDVKG